MNRRSQKLSEHSANGTNGSDYYTETARRNGSFRRQFSRFQNWPLIDGISRMQLSHEGKQRRDQDFLLRRMEVDESFILRYDEYKKFRTWKLYFDFHGIPECSNINVTLQISRSLDLFVHRHIQCELQREF